MEVTLHGGPHDGRRIKIDPAVAAYRTLFVPDPVEFEWTNADDMPLSAPRPPISVYQAKTWKDGPSFWLRWTYTGHQ